MEELSLKVSEQFYSIQGEGPSVGIPAIFLRLQNCVLKCQWCDTLEVWKRGTPIILTNLVKLWKDNGWLEKLQDDKAHLILTGGDPLIQQDTLVEFLSLLVSEGLDPYVEVETEGVLLPTISFDAFIRQYNVSPKLANSGMEYNRRVKPEVIKFHALSALSYFKFVVTSEADVEEAEETYIKPFEIPPHRVFLMPEGQTTAQLTTRFKWLAEVCKERCYRFSTRLHVHIWEQTTGV